MFNGEESIALPWSVVLAALAIEHHCTLCSADSNFRRFAGLRFCNPLL